MTSSRSRRARGAAQLLVVLVAAGLALGGCAGDDRDTPSPADTAGTPDPSPSASPEPSPEPEPTSTPSASPSPSAVDGRPALQDLVISTAGLGPLTVGDVPPPANPGSAMIVYDPDYCSGMEGDTDPGRWVAANYPPDENYMGEEPANAFYVDASDIGVHRIDIMGVSPATAEGIRVGSSLEELRAAYPSLEGPFAGPGSQVWVLRGPTGAIAFETQGDADGLRPAGTEEGVILIRVLSPGYPPEFAAANSDNVAGGCL